MNTLVHADIFFFVTTIAIAIVAVFVIIGGIFILRILKDVRYISGVARRETDLLAADLAALRQKVKRDGAFSGLAAMVTRLWAGRGKKVERKK